MGFFKALTGAAIKELQDYFKPAVIEALNEVLREYDNENIVSDEVMYVTYRDAYAKAQKKLTAEKG